MPAGTPGPMMATSSKAQISALIDRLATITSSARGRTKRTLGVVLRAAMKATGTAMTIAASVPIVAMLMVSQRGCISAGRRSEEHTSELQSLMRISYAVFCLKKKKYLYNQNVINNHHDNNDQ